MGRVYQLAELGALIGERRPPRIMQLWLASGPTGELVGIFTDAIGALPSSGFEARAPAQPPHRSIDVPTHLLHLASMHKCLSDDRLGPLTGLMPQASITVLDELLPDSWGQGVLVIDGRTTATDTVDYRGLNFALASDVTAHPVLVLRTSGSNHPWPELRSLEAAD